MRSHEPHRFLFDKMTRRQRQACALVNLVFGTSYEQLLGSTRGSPKSALARQTLMFVLLEKSDLTFTEVGTLIGRDRKTVTHGYCRVFWSMKGSRALRIQVKQVLDGIPVP